MKPENVRMIEIERSVDSEEMRVALGPLYDYTIPIPDVKYKELSMIDSHREQQLVSMLLYSSNFSASGPQREASWSDSWEEVFKKFETSNYDLSVLDPPYVSSHSVVRWMGYYVRAVSSNFEMEVYKYIRQSVFSRFMLDTLCIHDVGAGSCFNAVAYAQFNPSARVFTYDWAPASSSIAEALRDKHGMNICGNRYDFYDSDITLDPDDVVMTTCALEQVGDKWQSFLDNMLRERPKRVVHIEPILEKYDDEDKGIDFVAAEYHKQRNYLNGYYPELLKLRDAGEIDIVCDHRTGIGSRFHECYTVIAWEPR